MNLSLGLAGLAAIAAFVVGYALNQGSTCAVLAARQVLEERQPTLLLGFAVAAATAGLVWLPLAWTGITELTPDRATGPGLIAGAALLGAGAVLNRACLLGSISRIGDGRFSYLGLPVGLFFGFIVSDMAGAEPSPVRPNMLGHVSEVSALVLVGFGVLLWLGWAIMRVLGDRKEAHRWSARSAMVVLGVAGATLFAAAPGWTLADAVRLAVPQGPMAPMAAGAPGLGMFILLCLGAVVSGLRRRSFVPRRPHPAALLRSISGGAVMAVGASLVPGGNDTLLLAALPGATIGGAAAYGTMTLVVFALLLGGKVLSRLRPLPPAP